MADELEFLARGTPPPAYEIRDLGLLDDGRFCHAMDVNSEGHVVGEADTTEGVHGFVWRRGAIVDLTPHRRIHSSAIAINDDGYILGVIEETPNQGRVARLWTASHEIRLDGLGIGGGGVRAINNNAQIVGEMLFDEVRPAGAFLWQLGNITDLAGRYVDGSTAEAINNYGQVTGYLTTLRQFDQAFFWTDNRLFDLGIGQGRSINDHAVIAGMTYQGNCKPIACVWENLQRREIPLLRGSIASEAFAVNNGAEVVGAMTLAEGNRAAFLWKREYIIDLNTVIDPVLGWNLQEARAINNSGQIAGWGYLEHRHHGYLLTPSDRAPTPASPVPPPHQGAEAIDIPDIAPERTEMSFQDMIMQQIAEEARR